MIHPNQLNDATIMANLSCFRSAAHHLSFTRAATELGLTQGAVSHRIKKLEQLLGFQLFLRFNRRLQLTQEGEQLLQVVNQSLLSLEQTVRSLRAKELSIEVNLSLPLHWHWAGSVVNWPIFSSNTRRSASILKPIAV